jgi:lysophospholipase L1-like esterase
MRQLISAILCIALILTLSLTLFSCNVVEDAPATDASSEKASEQNSTEKPTDKETDTPTEKPTSKPKPKPTEPELDENDVTKFDLYQFLYPIWEGNISYAEAAFVRESKNGGIEPIELLYPIDDIISVRSADLKTLYVPGEDYYIDEGKLCIMEGGNIPVLAYDDYHFPLTQEEHDQNKLATKLPEAGNYGWGFIRAEIGKNKPGMSQWTLAVTYTHNEDAECVVNVPTSKSAQFDNLVNKLNAGQDIKIVSTGDSITDGWSASGKPGVDMAPYCPQYNVLVEQYIKDYYGVNVTQKNVGVSGSNTNGGVSKLPEICAEKPDLVIIAFGMNDGCSMAPNTYIANINNMVSTINKNCPDACIVVVGTCLPNEEFAWNPGGESALKYHIDYIDYLKEAEPNWKNAAHADVTTTNIELYERKVYQDLAGSNSNHPNDYMHRIYAQVIIQTIFGDYLSY